MPAIGYQLLWCAFGRVAQHPFQVAGRVRWDRFAIAHVVLRRCLSLAGPRCCQQQASHGAPRCVDTPENMVQLMTCVTMYCLPYVGSFASDAMCVSAEQVLEHQRAAFAT